VRLRLRTVERPLRAPFIAAHGPLELRQLLLAALDDDGGLTGYGEAAPLESYDGVSIAQVRDALRDCEVELADATLADALDPVARAELLARCQRRAVLPQALAAIDLALWDLSGRARGEPVWRLLAESAGADSVGETPGGRFPGAPSAPAVTVNWTISSPDRAGAAREAALALKDGFGTVKLKVGTGDDAGRVAAVRAAGGSRLAIRLDANGAWSPTDALHWLEILAPAGIELCEEPVAGADAIEALARDSAIPLAIDESAAEPAALSRRCAHAICLKVARCGGITGLLDAARQARVLGYEVFLASSFDGPLGIAAALHAAAVIEPDRACGLATLGMFAGDRAPLPIRSGVIEAPDGPGLGDDLIGWY
jgi:o-succinylbenzoate synthase